MFHRVECEPEDLYLVAQNAPLASTKEYFVGPVLYKEYSLSTIDVVDACLRLHNAGDAETLTALGVDKASDLMQKPITLTGGYTFVINPKDGKLITLLDEEE